MGELYRTKSSKDMNYERNGFWIAVGILIVNAIYYTWAVSNSISK